MALRWINTQSYRNSPMRYAMPSNDSHTKILKEE